MNWTDISQRTLNGDNMYLEEYWTSWAIGEMHINTDLRFLLIPVTMAIEKQMNTSWEIPGWEREALIYHWWECELE